MRSLKISIKIDDYLKYHAHTFNEKQKSVLENLSQNLKDEFSSLRDLKKLSIQWRRSKNLFTSHQKIFIDIEHDLKQLIQHFLDLNNPHITIQRNHERLLENVEKKDGTVILPFSQFFLLDTFNGGLCWGLSVKWLKAFLNDGLFLGVAFHEDRSFPRFPSRFFSKSFVIQNNIKRFSYRSFPYFWKIDNEVLEFQTRNIKYINCHLDLYAHRETQTFSTIPGLNTSFSDLCGAIIQHLKATTQSQSFLMSYQSINPNDTGHAIAFAKDQKKRIHFFEPNIGWLRFDKIEALERWLKDDYKQHVNQDILSYELFSIHDVEQKPFLDWKNRLKTIAITLGRIAITILASPFMMLGGLFYLSYLAVHYFQTLKTNDIQTKPTKIIRKTNTKLPITKYYLDDLELRQKSRFIVDKNTKETYQEKIIAKDDFPISYRSLQQKNAKKIQFFQTGSIHLQNMTSNENNENEEKLSLLAHTPK